MCLRALSKHFLDFVRLGISMYQFCLWKKPLEILIYGRDGFKNCQTNQLKLAGEEKLLASCRVVKAPCEQMPDLGGKSGSVEDHRSDFDTLTIDIDKGFELPII
ncbi:hypothetical protein BTVI_93149 [Pitangus sulphuratus]|nr:hypothetical protein BTVI_93149 [Pitangus sulphuratus]